MGVKEINFNRMNSLEAIIGDAISVKKVNRQIVIIKRTAVR